MLMYEVITKQLSVWGREEWKLSSGTDEFKRDYHGFSIGRPCSKTWRWLRVNWGGSGSKLRYEISEQKRGSLKAWQLFRLNSIVHVVQPSSSSGQVFNVVQTLSCQYSSLHLQSVMHNWESLCFSFQICTISIHLHMSIHQYFAFPPDSSFSFSESKPRPSKAQTHHFYLCYFLAH